MRKIFLNLLFVIITSYSFATGHVVNTFVIYNTTCSNANGQIYATISGGVGPFTYSWNTSPVQNNDTAFAVLAGSYTVTVTDQNDMSVSTGTVTVSNIAGPNLNINNPNTYVCESSTINLQALVSGGTSGYTYNWTGPNGYTGSVQNIFFNAWLGASGTYTLIVTDANGCTDTATTSVIVNSMPQIYVNTVNNISCFGSCDGSLTAMVMNPSGFETYYWTSSQGIQSTGQTITNVCAGSFTVAVTNGFGCTNAYSNGLYQPTQLTSLASTIPASSCTACDGSATVIANGGTSPYSYIWMNNTTTSTSNNLCLGNYSCIVTDANGCVDTTAANVNSSTVQATFTVITDSCNLGLGAITANVINPTQNITYNWVPGNSNNQTITGLTPGDYTVTITDSLCSWTDKVNVPNVSQIHFTMIEIFPSSCGVNNGYIDFYAYATNNSTLLYSLDGFTYDSSNIFRNLAPGPYTLYVKDTTGCVNSVQKIVSSVNNETLMFTTANSFCSNNNGSITVYPSNFNGPYTYLWQPGSLTTQSISNLAPGNYTCTVTGSDGCVLTQTNLVSQQNNIYLGSDYDFYNCGYNSLTAVSSFGQAPYSYNWQPGGLTTQTILNQNSGTYTCTVTDNTGCAATGLYSIYNSNNTAISGNIFNDANSNCVFDAGDSLMPQWTVYANSNVGNGWAWAGDGSYQMYLPNLIGTYTINAYPPGGPYGNSPNYYLFNCGTATATINTNCDTVLNVNVPVTTLPSQDLSIDLYCGRSAPGFMTWNSIFYRNAGTLTTANTIVSFDLDPLLTYIGATPAPTTVSGNHFEFNVGTLAPGQYGWITINAVVPTIQNGGALGTLIDNSASISIFGGEQTPVDNVYSCSTPIMGSYDPNEKEVFAENMSPSGAIDITGRKMYYTVHFQNTGTDTAFTITVRDTISDLLDLTSLEMLTASHAYTTRILPNRTLEVTFNNILLVDSNRNETLSHGYFNYAIHTKSGLQNGDNIANKAGIYFDFNLPVITNTVNTPVLLSVVGIKETSNSLMASVFPNPLSNGDLNIKFNVALSKNVTMRIYGIGGNEVFTKQLSNNNQQSVNVAGLVAGLYFVRLSDEAGRSSDIKLVITK